LAKSFDECRAVGSDVMITETNHPYYCSGSNFFSNGTAGLFQTVSEFLDAFENLDIDMNLCFRFDIGIHDDGNMYAELFLILQRKGIFKSIHCVSYSPETESARLEEYLKKHYDVLMAMWTPFSEIKQ